jgi:pimeloyl-ACP methyl ester carboxylesterase
MRTHHIMFLLRRFLLACVVLGALWLGACAVLGVVIGEAVIHPSRRTLTDADEVRAAAVARQNGGSLSSVSIRADDGVSLQGWRIEPARWNGDYVILLHGQSDNRSGMLGPADMLLRHGDAVLLPDARAHGLSGGTLATYGVLERNDIRDWFDWIDRLQGIRCIDAIGDSMGAAQLLESLSVERRFCAVIAESPFATLREAAYDRMGQQLGTGPWAGRTLLRPAVESGIVYLRLRYGVRLDQAAPAESVGESRTPVFLIHGLKDDNLPPRHSQIILALNHGANPNVTLWAPANAGHCEASTADPDEYERRVISWLQVHDPRLSTTAQRN